VEDVKRNEEGGRRGCWGERGDRGGMNFDAEIGGRIHGSVGKTEEVTIKREGM